MVLQAFHNTAVLKSGVKGDIVLTKWLFDGDDRAIEPSEILHCGLCGSEGILNVIHLSFQYDVAKGSNHSRSYMSLQCQGSLMGGLLSCMPQAIICGYHMWLEKLQMSIIISTYDRKRRTPLLTFFPFLPSGGESPVYLIDNAPRTSVLADMVADAAVKVLIGL